MNKFNNILCASVLIYGAVLLSALVFRGGNIPDKLVGWQAVFLSDGQVYFGRLTDENKEYALLRDVYYLKYKSSIQQDLSAAEKSSENLNLVKLGGEVHGPEPEMYISKSHILFIENLKPNSRVVEAIEYIR